MRTLVFLLWLLCIAGVAAQDTAELAKNNPVAVVSLAQGGVEFKRPDGEWQPAYWLTLLRPEDQLRIQDKGRLVVDFFSDDHLEVVEPGTEVKVGFKSLTKVSGNGIRREQARDRAAVEIEIPYMLMRKLFRKEFQGHDEPGAMEKEKIFLAASVRPDAYPPVFQWKDIKSPTYRLQIFNEWDEVKYEATVKGTRFKYPYSAPFNLAKNSQYLWQVTTPQDVIAVRKYAFIVMTKPHAVELDRAEARFANLKAAGKANQSNYTDLFLLYNNRKLVDRTVSILHKMVAMDPENPMIYRALVRAYLAKGCPAHAMEAHNRQLQLNGVDPITD